MWRYWVLLHVRADGNSPVSMTKLGIRERTAHAKHLESAVVQTGSRQTKQGKGLHASMERQVHGRRIVEEEKVRASI